MTRFLHFERGIKYADMHHGAAGSAARLETVCKHTVLEEFGTVTEL
jgi:hypothetical protein